MALAQAREVRTTCPYCGVGCGVLAGVAAGGAVSVRGDPDHPANFGRLCSKGSALADTLDLDGRLLHPHVGERRATWDEAMALVAAKFADAIDRHGPDSVAFYLSGQLLTEDYYVANKLMKGFIGAANVDTNSRLCMASSVAGHRRAFGSDTVPGTYEDLDLADLVVIVGANPAWCHPVLHQRIAAARERRPRMRVVLVDPRRTMSADAADLHLAIAPDGDVALFAGLLGHLARSTALDRDYIARFTTGFEATLAVASRMDLGTVTALTGLPARQIGQFYALFAATEKTVTVFSQGVNQSACGTDKVNAIINCHLATGRIGRPGMGPFSLTGQPNAMGGREVGGLANMLAAHLDIEDAGHRDIARRFWRSPTIAARAGLKAVDLFRAVGDGRIRALWIMATNPVDSLPEADAVRAGLAACPFVVVSDVMAQTDTTRLAHVRLPSLAWGEKDGTVTNSERRVSRQRAFLPAPGEARADWQQIAELGRRLGHGDAFAWSDAAAVFAEYAAMTAFENGGSRDLDVGAFAAISRPDYDRLEPFQWPRPAGAQPISTRFFASGGFFTPDGKARFIATEPAVAARTTGGHALVLNTGRVRDHWHTLTRTGKSARLSAHVGEPFAELHPADAAALGVTDADIVEVASAHGRVLVRARITDRQRRGAVFVPMHWNDKYAGRARIDAVIAAVTDPTSGQPALKRAAVSVRRFAALVHGFAVSQCRPDARHCDYWAVGRIEGGWRLELAHGKPLGDIEAVARVLFGAECRDGLEAVAYRDGEHGHGRLALFDGPRLAAALFLAPEPVAVSRSWAVRQLGLEHAERAARWRLVAGRPAADMPDKGAIVCSCFGVGAGEIAAAARSGCASVAAVGAATGAGTNCGSCRGEIRGIIDAHRAVAAG